MVSVEFTRELYVTASIKGKIVSYNVFQSRQHIEPGKITRYSELATLQKALQVEEPDFRGALPPKTLVHQTSPDFVESRRLGIQQYLHMCAQNEYVRNSEAWRAFLSDAVPRQAVGSLVSDIPPESAMGTFAGELPSFFLAFNHETQDEDANIDGSVYDKVRMQLTAKQAALAEAIGQQSALNQRLSEGQTELESAEDKTGLAVAGSREVLTRLAAHQFSLQELEREMLTQKGIKADLEASKTTEVKSLNEGLAAAIEATRAGREKLDAARSARSRAEADGKNKILDVDTQIQGSLVEHAAATEHLASMRSALSVMADRLKEREAEARKIEIEHEVALKTRDRVQEEADVIKDDVREMTNTVMNTSKARSSHIESSARRSRACDSEVRRAKECADYAAKLRDRQSRGELLGDDRKGFDTATVSANKGAESAARTYAIAIKRSEETVNVDSEKMLELCKADEDATASLKRHEVVLKQMQTRLSEVEMKVTGTSERRACTNAAKKVAREDHNNVKYRVEGSLQQALVESEKKLADAKAIAQVTHEEVQRELAPLSHKEEAERVVLKQAEDAEANLVQLLDEARMLAAEAKADQHDAKPDDHEKVQLGESRSLLIESAKARVVDHIQEVEKATMAARDADDALKKTEPRLRKLESIYEKERASFRKEVEAVLAEEVGSRGSSFADELQHLTASEDDSPILQQMLQRITVEKAVLDDQASVFEEKNAALRAAVTVAESSQAELAQLEVEETNAEMPPLTRYYLTQELNIVGQYMKRHEARQDELLSVHQMREAEWAKDKAKIQEDLHQAAFSIEVAKDDVEATKAIPKNIRRSLEN